MTDGCWLCKLLSRNESLETLASAPRMNSLHQLREVFTITFPDPDHLSSASLKGVAGEGISH